MGIHVKICGCCSAGDVEAIAGLKPDALGFVFWAGSERCVRADDVKAWTRGLPASIKKVGVFVDAARDEIRVVREEAGLDIVQIHGREDPDYCAGLGGDIWKAIHLNRPVPGSLEAYADSVSAFLIDYGGDAQPGGTGRTVDWEAAARFVTAAPAKVVLAGGLHAGNVAEAINRVRPWGVDVSSGVEAKVGSKDINKVKDFIDACRNAP